MGHGFWTPYILFVCLETSVNYWCSYQKQHQQAVIIQWACSYNVEGQLYCTILYEGSEHVQIIVSVRVSEVNPLHIPRDYYTIHESPVVWTCVFIMWPEVHRCCSSQLIITCWVSGHPNLQGKSFLPCQSYSVQLIFLKKYLFLFICLCLVAAHRIFVELCMWTLSCSMWDLVPWPGIEPRLPTLRVQSLSHWTTREVPVQLILRIYMQDFWEYIPVKFLLLGFVAPDFVCDGSLLVQDSRWSC